MKYASLATAAVSQAEPLNERQVENNAGGYVFQIDDWARLDRFLILGSDAPTYYQNARPLTRENAAVVERCYTADAARTVARIVEISDAGRAPKNDPAVFALAIGAAHQVTTARQLALAALPKVCRTGTHLFQFVTAVRALGRGWGRTLKRAVAAWYDGKTVDQVAFQAIKYRSRDGYSHKRLLQTAHPGGAGQHKRARTALYRWICEKSFSKLSLPKIVSAHIAAMKLDVDGKGLPKLLKLIKKHRLPWEAVPTEANAKAEVWATMLPDMGLTAMIRNLGNMTRVGTIKPLSESEQTVVARLGDELALRKSRVHPFAVLQAMTIYGSGRGLKGSGVWDPSRPILDALDGAFYKAFANVEPTGKRHLIALDVSGSMGTSFLGSGLSAREAAAALALVTMAIEPVTHVIGFTASGHAQHRFGGRWGGGRAEVTPLSISPRQRLDDVVSATANLPFGGTDCALPMLYAIEKGLAVDAFVVITDNETWAGQVHPVKALQDYRKKSGIPAKLIVVGMTATEFSIADPKDAGMLDVVGFDANCPALIADFIRG